MAAPAWRWRPSGAIALALLACATHAGDSGGTWGSPDSTQHAAHELTEDDFDAFMAEHPVSAILFHAPWCFHCQSLMPQWDTAAQKLQLHDPPVPLAKIDTPRHSSVGDRYGIHKFPAIKLFVEGAEFNYDARQARGWQQIVNWVNRHIDRDYILKGAEDADEYLHDNDLNVVGLFPDGYDSSAFAAAARHFDDVMFAESRGTEISKQIAGHVSKHATFLCETVDVGISRSNAKEVELPRPGMQCSSAPRNPQRVTWEDQFNATVEGQRLLVTRTDEPRGWLQRLQLQCCDDESGEAGKKSLYQISLPSVVMFMPHDERFAIYDGDLTDAHALERWVSGRRLPLVMRFTPETAQTILDRKDPVLFLVSAKPNAPLERALSEAALQLRGRVVVCFSGTGSQIEKRLAAAAGVEDGSPPVVTLLETRAGEGSHTTRKYRIATEGLTASAVVQLVADYERGALKPWLRSEPEPSPEDAASSLVGVLVGTSFAAATQDATKDVLVNFYAPWCGHCRKFEPTYKVLAQQLKHVDSLRVMKIDATRNEVEGVELEGFPTIILFPAGRSPKMQMQYVGKREPDEMVRWLHEQCTVAFDDKPPVRRGGEPNESGLLDASEEDL